jgi:hypothetical protein
MAASRRVVFYSWQSDLPNRTNRGFIEQALENAAKALRNDDSIQIKPVIDRDTAGVAGSPDISKTIFSKISQADIFVCDISIINQGTDARPTPNPNVLIELGYALGTLGESRIILVVNDVFGKLELLPFDLRARRTISYHMPEEINDRATERKILEGRLTQELRTILTELDASLPEELIQPLSLAEQARTAIETARLDQAVLVRQYMTELANKIDEMTPTFSDNEQDRWDELLLQVIGQLTEMVLEFAQLAETIALINAAAAAQAMYEGFSHILDLYTFPPPSRSLRYHTIDHDLAKFFGHELFVIFFSYLIREKRWELIANLLDEDLYARTENFGPPRTVPFYQISEPILLLDEVRKQRLKSNRISLHADLLNERHTQGDIAKDVPIEQFAEADYFLFLRAQLQPATITSQWPLWMAWSSLYVRHLPRYLEEAKRVKYAQQLLRPLGVEDIPTLRTRLAERTGILEKAWGAGPFRIWDNVLAGFDFNTIGSR